MDKVVVQYTGKIPSVNHVYGTNRQGYRYLTREGKNFKKVVALLTRGNLPVDVELGYKLTIMGNWYNKAHAKTRIKKRDTNNMVKLILDACCDAMGIDDSQIFEEHIYKVQSETEGFVLEMYLVF